MALSDPSDLNLTAKALRACVETGTTFSYNAEDNKVSVDGEVKDRESLQTLKDRKTTLIALIEAAGFARIFYTKLGLCAGCKHQTRTVGPDLLPWHPGCWEQKENADW